MTRRLTWNLRATAILAATSLAIGCSGSGAGIDDGSSGGSGPAGIGGATPGAAMFGTPTGSATPDSIYGVWGGSLEEGSVTFDTRVKLAAGSMTVATRCTLANGSRSDVVGVTAAARITNENLTVLETKSDAKDDGVVKCSVNLTPRQLARCTADMIDGFERNCFKLTGTTLVEFGTSGLDKLELTKLSD
jgi:hypothetical protein